MVSPRWIKTIVQPDWGKQADVEREAGSELVDDLPWSEPSLVRVGTSQVEVELVERRFGEEVGAGAEGFQVVELVLDEAMDGFDVALVGVGGGRDALVLGAEVSDGGGKVRTGAVKSRRGG